MPFERILSAVRYSPWFLIPGAYTAMVDLVDLCVARAKTGAENLEPKLEGFSLRDMQSRKPMQIDRNGVANIHVFGTMGRNLSPLEKVCGRTDYADLEKEIGMAQAQARAARFEFDTPGGSALGTSQLAKMIGNMTIPKAGFTESLCASAGMYLAAGLDRFYAEDSSMIGSIGTLLPWVDTTKMQSLMGVRTEVFTNAGADLKGMRGDIPLSEEQRAHLQTLVDDLGKQFQAHIADYRAVDEEVFRAGSYLAPRGVELGLADGLGGAAAADEYLLTTLRG